MRGLLTFAILATTLLLTACSPKPANTGGKGEVAPVPVTVVACKTVELRRTVPVSGTLHAHDDVMVATKADGRVTRVMKNAGDTAYPGEVLLELDPTNYALTVEQGRLALLAELKKLKLDAIPPTDAGFTAHLPSIDSVAQAKANHELAEKELARAEFEHSKGVGSIQVLDSAKTRVKVAKTSIDLAETEARVTLAHARRMKAMLEDSEEKLRETQLRAPVPDEWAAWSAVVGPAANPVRFSVAARHVSPGTVIPPMQVKEAFRLVLDHSLKLRAPIPERHRPEVKPGQAVEVRVDAYEGKVFAGEVVRVFPAVDEVNRTFMAEIEVPNYDRKLSAGGFANAEIVTRTDTAVLTVPSSAVVSFAGVNKVFVVEGSTAKAIEVELGARERDWVEVRGKLAADARVITSGQSQLVDGAAIRVR